MLKWVVFDFGDTLYDLNFVRESLLENESRSRIFRKFGLKVSEKKIAGVAEKIRHLMKGSIERHSTKLMLNKIGKIFGKNFTKMELDEMEKLYYKEELKYFKLLPHALEIVKFINKKGLRQALISNADSKFFTDTLQKSGLKKYFKLFLTSTEVGGEKSTLFPFMVFLARANKFIETKPEEVLMVGDRLDEDGSAAILGMRTVIFEGRSAKFAKFHGLQPDFKIRNLIELKKIINQLA